MAASDPVEAIWTRERDFHDAIARELDVDKLASDGSRDRLDLALLDLAGDVGDRRVLDAGCGQGDLTVDLLDRAANVTALDLSPGMIDVLKRRVARAASQPAQLDTVVAPLESSGLPGKEFDLVVGKFVLHHLDMATAGAELARILRPGGRAIFIENTGANPLLRFARHRLTGRWGVPRLGTEDEHPLTASDIHALEARFARVTAHYPVFEFCVLFDRQVLRFQHPRLSRAIRRIDDAIYRRLPRARRYSYRVILELVLSAPPVDH
jgi:SAM-dependent methyltransferase